MQLTDAQYRAVYTHDRNMIITASAGSGKTRVLVERYLALLDANPDWRLDQLVAITFTRKAAGEMRDRVRANLEARLRDATTDTDRERWAGLLAGMDGARISTIHGLCSDLLRANAAEAGVDPQFAVLEEADAAILLEDTVDRVLGRILGQGDPARDLLGYYDPSSVRTVLINRALLDAPLVDVEPDTLLAEWRAAWEQDARQFHAAFLREVERIGTWEPVIGDVIGERWAACLQELELLYGSDESLYLDALRRIGEIKLTGGSPAKWGDKETLAATKAALGAVRDAAKACLKQIGDPVGPLDEVAAYLLPLWLDLVRQTRDAFRDAKAERSALDFNDLENLTRDLLDGHPIVRQRYRNAAFRHLLVDEFQDTNAVQWAIIQQLADLAAPGGLFVVGDEKQSIYAFRGADVSVFGAVRLQITTAGGMPENLATSFRTHKLLVTCFNVLFAQLLVRDEASPVAGYQVEAGAPLEAHRQQPPGDVPAVEMILIDGKAVDGDTLHADDCRQWEAYELARRLRGMVEGGYPVYDREDEHVRPLRYDDIAILFRSLKESPIYEEVFKAMGLPFVTVGGRGYFDRQEVWDVLNLLAALYNPADDLALAVALRSPLFGLSDDALFALRLMRDDAGHILPLWDALAAPGLLLPDDERGLSAFAYDCLSGLRATAGRVSVAELLHDVLARTQYLAVLTGLPDGARRRGNVEKLLDIAQSRVHTTLGEFNRYVNQLTDRETREGEAAVEVTGAVTLMTIHASKGLEYPVVVLADASRAGRGGNNPALMYDPQAGFGCQVYDEDENKLVNSFACRRASNYSGARDDAENRRLLYVAATRAQDTLIMSGRATETKSGGWSAQGWLGQLLETFDLYDHLAHGVDTLIPQPWGALRLTVPYGGVPEDLLAAGDSSERIVWDQGPLSRSQPLPGSAVQPALTHTVSGRRDAQVRHLAATHIADLGSAMAATGPDADYFRDRFRRQVLQDSPAYVESGLVRQQGFNRTVGEIVHEALRWWRFPATVAADFDYMRMLRSYAQRFGVTDEDQIKIMANAAFRMLDRFQQSDVYGWVGGGDRIYRELPFIYEREGRIIHGIIDTLFRQPDGTWVILDYKTSYVDRSVGQPRAAEMHATRYHLQLGVYADAVTAQLDGAVPQTYIHYVRYGLTVRIAEADRRRALAQGLSERIVALLADRI